MKLTHSTATKKAWAIRSVLAMFSLLPCLEASATPIVQTTDMIADTERSAFNGFEGIPVPVLLTGGVTPFLYAEDGIEVGQVIGTAGTDSIFSGYTDWGGQGQRAWYPNGGDEGYTFIRRQSGADFSSLGLLRGSGADGKDILLFELYDDGLLTLSGAIPHTRSAQYLGFSGGGFDFIRLRDGSGAETSGFLDFSRNHLVVDSIELRDVAAPIPEPSTILLFVSGAFILLVRSRLRGRSRAAAIRV